MMIVYKTKASPIIKILFAVLLIVILIVSIIEKNMALLSISLGFFGLVLYVFYTTHYTVYQNTLTIKSGFLFSESIPIDTVKKISRKRRSLLSGPGFSSDRLIIEYGEHECVVISPLLKEAFVAHLKRVNPEIVYLEN